MRAARPHQADATGAPPADAVAWCREVIAKNSKSFALASRILPRLGRDRATVVYTWCRYADDAVDVAKDMEPARALERLRAELVSVYQGGPQKSIALAAFQEVVEACRIPREYPDELLCGMEMDVCGTRYDTMDTLLLYCFRVAGIVGLMMSHVMGLLREDALVNAAHMGMAMQLTNICRDVVEDWDMGRLYVPDEVLGAHGLAELRGELGGPFPRSAVPGMARAVQTLLGEAARYYRSGDQGLTALPWRCALAVRAARLVYSTIGERIAAARYDVTAGRAVVPDREKLALVARAGALAMTEAPARVRHAAGAGRAARQIRYRAPHSIIRYSDHVLRL